MPTVVVISNISIDEFYEQILYSIDQRYHNHQPTFPVYPTTEAEFGEIESLTAYASHASDDLHIGGVHLERLIG